MASNKVIAVQNKLWADFNKSAFKDKVVGAGVQQDNKGEFVMIYLAEKPTATEKKQMPKKQDGVRVKYEVTGQIFFQ